MDKIDRGQAGLYQLDLCHAIKDLNPQPAFILVTSDPMARVIFQGPTVSAGYSELFVTAWPITVGQEMPNLSPYSGSGFLFYMGSYFVNGIKRIESASDVPPECKIPFPKPVLEPVAT